MICVWPQFSVWSCCPFCLLPFFVVVVVVCFYPPLGCRLGQNVDHLSSAKLSSSARHPARNGERVGTHSVCNSLQKKIDGFLTESSLTQRIGKQQRLVGALAWFFCKGHFFFVLFPLHLFSSFISCKQEKAGMCLEFPLQDRSDCWLRDAVSWVAQRHNVAFGCVPSLSSRLCFKAKVVVCCMHPNVTAV